MEFFLASSACLLSASSYGVGSASPLLCAPILSPCLTRRSSRPAYGGRLTLFVSLLRICVPTAQVMSLSITVTHSQVLPLVFGRSAGLRLLAGSVFKAFLAVTVRPHSASSSVFHSIRRLAGVVFHPAANPAVKLTRQRRAAYFVRWAAS